MAEWSGVLVAGGGRAIMNEAEDFGRWFEVEVVRDGESSLSRPAANCKAEEGRKVAKYKQRQRPAVAAMCD